LVLVCYSWFHANISKVGFASHG